MEGFLLSLPPSTRLVSTSLQFPVLISASSGAGACAFPPRNMGRGGSRQKGIVRGRKIYIRLHEYVFLAIFYSLFFLSSADPELQCRERYGLRSVVARNSMLSAWIVESFVHVCRDRVSGLGRAYPSSPPSAIYPEMQFSLLGAIPLKAR